jgi:alkylation response protein AidB-like acyl-CoA dehydrogenase
VAESAFDDKDRLALLATIDDTLRDHWNPAEPGNSKEVWARLLELGIDELIAPAAQAGMNLPVTVLADVARTASRHLAPGPLVEEAFLRPWLAHHGWALRQVAGQQVALIDGAATFDWRGSRGEVRFDPVTGTLSGVVRGVANAPTATTLIVVGRRDEAGDAAAETIYAVPGSTPGVSVDTTPALDPGCPTGTVALTSVVPEAALPGSSPDVIAELRSWLRVLISAELLGIAEAVIELTRSYALQRHQFGRPIAAFQVIRHMLADMASRSSALGNLVTLVTSELSGMSQPERAVAAAALKAYAAGVTLTICEQALQMHGGIGFVEEYVLHRYFKAALRRHGLYGTPAELYERIGQSVLSMPA